MLAFVVATVLAADLRMAVLDFTGSKVEPELTSFCTQTYAARVAQGGGLVVTTPQDMVTVLGMERQRQLLGCGEGSCTAELAGALGLNAIANGQLARLGEQLVLTVRVIDASARPVAALTEEGTEGELAQMINRLALQTRQALNAKFTPEERLAIVDGHPSAAPWVPIIAGGVGVVAGAVLLGVAGLNYGRLKANPSTLSDTEADAVAAAGSTEQTAGAIIAGVGGAALLGGLLWRAFSSAPQPVAVGLQPSDHGLFVSVQGVLP
jgi:hypothetical protein